MYAKGSGVWYNIGKSITFKEHADAFAHFGVRDNEAMCRAAAAAGLDTVQFSAHHDHTNYPCDTAGGYPYMNIEIVAVKLGGTYACGEDKPSGQDPGHLKAGWHSKPCNCDNAFDRTNCGAVLRSIGRGERGRERGKGSTYTNTSKPQQQTKTQTAAGQ